MNMITNKLSPSATELIRTDHSHVIDVFHQYKFDADPKTKQASVNKNCLLIEIHAQIEEEFFYPALRTVIGDNAVLRKSVPEHDELRHLIGKLRSMDPSDASYDETYMQLMRNTLHHVADEESVLLSAAEHLLADRLQEIGAKMNKRKMQMMARHAGQMVSERVRARPVSSVLIAAGVALAGTVLARRSHGMRQAEERPPREISIQPSEGMRPEHAGFRLGQLIGMGQGMRRGFFWGRRSPA